MTLDADAPSAAGSDADKAAIRSLVLARRDALAPSVRSDAADAIARLIDELPVEPLSVVSGFLAIKSEIDPLPLLLRLAARGHPLCLPVVLPDLTTMQFRAWTPGEPLEASRFGLSVPPASAAVVEPEAMLVPLAAFDRRGYRIGYGKGHYDRAIARLEADGRPLLKIGIAFALQEVEAVPHEPHDRPLDMVLTEAGPIACGAVP